MANNYKIESLELDIWQGSPSQIINLKFFASFGFGLLICLGITFSHPFVGLIGIVVFSFLLFDKYAKVRDTKYELTHERLRIRIGGLLSGRKSFEIDIDDLRDVELHESFLDQIFGLGTIILIFKGDPLLSSYRDLFEKKIHIIVGIQDSAKSREIIRAGIKRTVNRETLDRNRQFNLTFGNERKNNPKLLD